MNNYKFDVGEFVFAKFRGKFYLGKIEYKGKRDLKTYYGISFNGVKRIQKKLEGIDEIKPTLKWDEANKRWY